jgi:DNA primase
LFDKSANLYGLNWARPEIVQSGRAAVVEGYLDALMCHQAGIAHVVATLGTAMTERHVRMLSRYAGEIVLVFDADAAGQAAAERAIELFLAQRVNVRVATIPQGDQGQVKDPCDYVLAAGEGAMRGLLDDAPDALEFAWRRRRERYEQAHSLAQKRAVIEEFLRLVVSSAAYGAIDALRQGLLVGHLAELLGISAADVTDRMRRVARQVVPARAGAPEPAAEPAGSERAERWVLAALLNAPELFGDVRERIDPRMFREPTLRTVAEQVWRLAGQGRLEIADLLGAGDSEQWGRLITDLQAAGAGRGNYRQSLLEAAEDLLRRRQKEQLQELRESPDADRTEVMRQVAAEARRPDRRRRPRP